MPKYLTRIEFESMKVLRNRKCTIKQISEKMHISAPAVSRNLKYHSYEDYCLSMHNRNSRGGREIEAKSGPVKVTKLAGSKKCNNCGKEKPLEDFVKDRKCKDGRAGQCKECRQEYIAKWKAKREVATEQTETVQIGKTCKKCGKAKPITEFDKNKNTKDGHAWQCKECRRAYQRAYDKRTGRHKAKPIVAPQKPVNACPTKHVVTAYYNPFRDCWVEEPAPKKEEKPKFAVDQYVLVEYKGKAKGAHLVAKCSDEYSKKWVVELCNWRRTKLIVSESDMYTEGAC